MVGISFFFILASVKAISYDTPMPTLTPTPTPTPTITPTPCPTPIPTPPSTCIVSLPSTTLVCPSPFEVCKQCSENQTCVQVGKKDDENYKCPVYECQDCPEPVCDPPCGCKEECVIEPAHEHHGNHWHHHRHGHGHHHDRFKSCLVAKCKALPVCLICPPVSCDLIKCQENYECKVNPGSCDKCPIVTCEPKPCVVCPTEPLTCMCPRGKECKIEEGSCYKCPVVKCVDIPDPCGDACKGECSVNSHPNCETCPPQRLCVEECRECSPFLPNWPCQNPRNALYISRTCSTCSQYRCLNECKDCSNHVPKCDCENSNDCVLQPRTCDQCPTYYCKKGKI